MLTLDTNIIISYLSDEKPVVEIILQWQIGGIAAGFRRNIKLSLGDSVIVATAYITGSTLVTLDKEIIRKAKNTIPIITI